MVAGLATVTPASGFIGVPGGIILGLAGGYLCYVAVDIIRNRLHIDDSLDVFAVHGGRVIGSLLVAVLATDSFSGLGLAEGMSIKPQFGVQTICVAITVIWTAFASPYTILKVAGVFGGLRVSEEHEVEGLIHLNMASAAIITASLF